VPGKKGQGLQNLNAMKYPWRVLWRRGVLPEKYAWMRPVMESFGDGLIQHKGGPETITDPARGLVEIAQLTRVMSMIIMHEAAERGYTVVSEDGRTWDLHPGAKELPKFLNLLRATLTDLGLERVARDVDKTVIVRRWSGSEAPPPSSTGGEYPVYETPTPSIEQDQNTAFPASDAKQEQK
jgi:hypothetical protein